MLCEFTQIDERTADGRATFRCKQCGRYVYRCKSPAEKIYAACLLNSKVKPLSMLEMGQAVAAAAIRYAKSNGKTVSQKVKDEREALCKACVHFDPALNRCNACGCFLSIKAWLPAEKCPLDPPKWVNVPDDSNSQP